MRMSAAHVKSRTTRLKSVKAFPGLVTDGEGKPKDDEGYITYGTSSEPDDEIGEIEIRGRGAAILARRIAELINTHGI